VVARREFARRRHEAEGLHACWLSFAAVPISASSLRRVGPARIAAIAFILTGLAVIVLPAR
jgi:hypothetical protein